MKKLPIMRKVPTGCEAIDAVRKVYVCDPAAALRAGQRVVVWGIGDYPGLPRKRLATCGVYRPRLGDGARGVVRLANWCGPQRGWEEMTYPCPPNTAWAVMGVLTKPRKTKPRRRVIKITRVDVIPRSR